MTFTTAKDVPGEPAKPVLEDTASNETSLSVRVFDAPYDGGEPITMHELEVVQQLLGEQTSYIHLPADERLYVLSGYVRDSAYRFRVRALNLLGYGAWSGVLEVVSQSRERPTAPTNLELVSDVLQDGCALEAGKWGCSFELRWSAPPGANHSVSHYALQYAATAATRRRLSDTTQTVNVPPTYCAGSSTIICHRMSGMRPGMLFKLSVRAGNSAGLSSESLPVLHVTTPATSPDQVDSLVIAGETQTSLEVSWVAPAANGQPLT
eukprot:465632-Prymnesium_polylepis.1